MRVENLRSLHDHRNIRPAFLHRVFPRPCSGKKHRKPCAICTNATVRKEEESRALTVTQRGRKALSQTTACAQDSLTGRKSEIDSLHLLRTRKKRCEFGTA